METQGVTHMLYFDNMVIFYYMVLVKEGVEAFNIVRFFRQLYVYNWNFSFWYLYVYIALLICLPLLQKIAQSLSNKDYIYMTIYISLLK